MCCDVFFVFLGGIASCRGSDSAYFSVAWSACLSSVTFAHLLKPFDGFKCHLACICLWVQWHIVLDGVHDLSGRGDLWVKHTAKTFSCKLLLPPGECNRGAIPRFAKLLWFLLYYLLCTRWMHIDTYERNAVGRLGNVLGNAQQKDGER